MGMKGVYTIGHQVGQTRCVKSHIGCAGTEGLTMSQKIENPDKLVARDVDSSFCVGLEKISQGTVSSVKLPFGVRNGNSLCSPPSREKLAHSGDHIALSMLGKAPAKEVLENAQNTLAQLDRPVATQTLLDSVDRMCWKNKAVYVSTPITGGDRLYSFLEKHGLKSKKEMTPELKAEYNREVIAENCSNAAEVNHKLRGEGKVCFAPSAFEFPDWSQTKYNEHWTQFVREAPLEGVVVCDGWQLSYGCLLEVRTALDNSIPVLTEHGEVVTRDGALKFVEDSKANLESKGFKLGLLSQALTEPLETLPMELT